MHDKNGRPEVAAAHPQAIGAVSVVIPCYNEAPRLERWRELITANAFLDWEWIFVNDGSRDNSREVLAAMAWDLEPCGMRIVDLPQNRGKGAAVRAGFLAASRPCVGYVDADLAASPLAFQLYLDDAVRQGHTLLLGIRLLTTERLVQRKVFRHVLGRIYQTLFAWCLGSTIYDSQCGFKLLATTKARALAADLHCDGFAFDAELLLLAQQRYDMHLREVPIAWVERGGSSVRPWSACRMLVDLWLIRRRLRRHGSQE
ncbi:MAG: glycosyltransferase [Lentisphaeria bacterium]|nr:glycosyltransferase [Lentisphaeria bacterium]